MVTRSPPPTWPILYRMGR